MSFIDNLSQEDITKGYLPIKDLLTNSLYYPSCGFDGSVVKFLSSELQSFVYCDYATGEEALQEHQNSFLGYTLFASRSVNREELVPNGWLPQLPPNTDPEQYTKYKKHWQPFAKWLVYERNTDRGETHGPKRFSILYIGGEGVATYQALYSSNNQVPTILAIIQPGTGFGFNWTNFRSLDGPLYWTVNSNPAGIPKNILNGGWGDEYEMLGWPGYEYAGTIRPYYNEGGMVTMWSRKGVYQEIIH